jgi:hypothetical protein
MHLDDKIEAYCEAIRLTHRRTIDMRANFVVRTIGALLVDPNDFARQEAYWHLNVGLGFEHAKWRARGALVQSPEKGQYHSDAADVGARTA